ncbi:hypothetical protein [Massilia sp. 9I]|uniref:hypothetical protein n=1 Tax=Massilia sp. 9I TaxID=2653152 RepID=UPI0012F1B2F0|nr:hypothetical protein [Massilia sp. 9I]VXB79364.1 conserved exported hypothetical protein [Massilia sp. 9I]
MHISLPRLSRTRCRLLAGAALLCYGALPALAASSADLVKHVLTPAYLDRMMCNDVGLLQLNLLNALKRGSPTLRMPAFSDAQIREIGARYDELNASGCAALEPLHRDPRTWERNAEKAGLAATGDARWDRFLADPAAVKWANVVARFRMELVGLESVMRLQLSLRRNIYNPRNKDLPADGDPALRKLEEEVRRVSLTEEEAAMRMVLANAVDLAAMREMLPARYQIDSLVRLEAKTRQIGLQLLERHGLALDRLFDAKMRRQLLVIEDKETGVKLNAVAHAGEREADRLADRVRRDGARPR